MAAVPAFGPRPIPRPLVPDMMPAVLRDVTLAHFQVPAPNPDAWIHNLHTLQRLHDLVAVLGGDEPPLATCVTLAAPSHVLLEGLLVAAFWRPMTELMRRSLTIPPRERPLAPVYYVSGPALGLLLAGQGLASMEERLRASLITVGALFVPDLERAVAEDDRLLRAVLLSRRQARRPWFVTWQGPQTGAVWDVLREHSVVCAFQG